MEKRTAVFPGSFDPFTRGHQDIVLRALSLFDHIIIGIGHNTKKKRYFPVEEVLDAITKSFGPYPSVSVELYSDLTANFARERGARFLLRGLRNGTDLEYENPIAQANRHVDEGLETVFMITSPEFAYISSSIVRELHRYGQDVSKFLPDSH